MATRAVIEIQGDSDSAVKAIDAAERSISALDAQIDDMGDTMSAASKQAAGFTSSQSQMQNAARVTTQRVQGASSALGSLSSSIGQVNPAAGAAASALSSLGGGIGSLASLANPATAAVLALGVAVTAGAALWKRNKDELDAYNKSLDELAVATAKANEDITRIGQALRSTETAFAFAANASDELRQAFAEVRAERARLEAAESQGRLHEVGAQAAVVYTQELGKLVVAQRAAREATEWAATVQNGNARAAREAATAANLANKALREQEAAVEAARLAVQEYTQNARDLEEAEQRVATSTRESNVERQRAVTDYNALADATLKAAVASQDFARINAEIASGSGIGSALTSMLDGLDVSMLEALGLDVGTFTAAVDAAKSGLVSLKDVLDGMAADRLMEESLRAQSEWYDRMMLSAKELLELEEAEYRIAMDKLANGELLEAHERRLIELRRERNSLDGVSGDTGIQLEMAGPDTSRLDEINDKLGMFGQSAEGMAQSAFGSLNDAIMQSIESGEKLGDVLPAAFLKSIGSMASQMASLAAAQALMMTFTPGMQGNAAGLWGATAALTAVAIGAGVAVKAVGKRGSGGGSSSSDAPSGDRTTTYIEGVESNRYHQSGIRARTYGADQANADRLHIDRGQSWA